MCQHLRTTLEGVCDWCGAKVVKIEVEYISGEYLGAMPWVGPRNIRLWVKK